MATITASRSFAHRAGMTLIELIVAMSIIILLAGMVVAFWPGVSEQQRAADGATMFESWLRLAKVRAFRDQKIRGLRLLIDPATLQVVQCQYVDQPDDFYIQGYTANFDGSSLLSFGPPPTPPLPPALPMTPIPPAPTPSSPVDFTQGQGISVDPSLWAVQAGDYLEINGGGLVHQITAVGQNTLTLASFSGTMGAGTGSGYLPGSIYRVIRAPRIAGDEQLQLPTNIIVDLSTNATYGNPLPLGSSPTSLDILFSPAGTIITPGVSTDFLGLWVRDVNGSDPYQLGPTILAVWTRSGLIAAHPPNDSGGDAYQFVKDGRAQ